VSTDALEILLILILGIPFPDLRLYFSPYVIAGYYNGGYNPNNSA